MMAEAAREQVELAQFIEPEPSTRRVPGELRLIRLRLRNFKGIAEFELDAGGQSIEVYGDNATGKTTLFDAFTWLLFDKDSANRKEFEIKTLGRDGEAAHGLEHEVEGVFRHGGRTFSLRKVYSEQWTKRRGAAEREFTGHTTEYFIDGVPVRKGDYDSAVAAICDEKLFRLLSDPSYFNEQLHWQERRALLLEVCGDIDDREVIATDPELAPLAEILGKRSLEDHKKVVRATRAKINKELEQIPVRISEVQRGLPDIAGFVPDKAAKDLEAARTERKRLLEELALIEGGGEAAQVRRRLSEIDAELLDIETRARTEVEEALSAKRRALEQARTELSRGERELEDKRDVLRRIEERTAQVETDLEALRAKYRAVAAETFDYADETACPTCGQVLPQEMVEAARAKALERFNASRAERLERLNAEGKALRGRKDQADREVERYRLDCQKVEAALPALRAKVSQLEAEVAALAEAPLELDEDPDHQKLVAERAVLTQKLEAGHASQPDTGPLRAKLERLESEVAALERTLSEVEQHRRGLSRIRELKAEEKRLAAEYERLERELFLIEAFDRAKVRLLTDRINSRFRLARFKLFNVLVNGALEDCCETTVDGVPYGTALNRGARLNVGLDIIETLAEHYGFRAPIWIDNREAVTRLIPIKGQLISLVVSEPDKNLRVEVIR